MRFSVNAGGMQMKKDKDFYRRLWIIAANMFRIGCLTFGGGWSIIVQMEEEFVVKRNFMTREALTDDLALGKSFPGIMIINTSVIFGYQVCGVLGAVTAAVALSLPALISIAVVAYFYQQLKSNLIVTKILGGIRCAVVPIILSAAFKLKANNLTSHKTYALAAISFIICAFTGVPKTVIVIAGGILGFILFQRRTEGEKDALS